MKETKKSRKNFYKHNNSYYKTFLIFKNANNINVILDQGVLLFALSGHFHKRGSTYG